MKQSVAVSLVCTILLLSGWNTWAQSTPKIVVVGIDAKTESALGPFGSSYRVYHSKIIQALNKAGAKGIVFAISFGENPSQTQATEAIAATAANSKAPVVIEVYSERESGTNVLKKEPNAAVFAKYPQIGQACALVRQELLFPESWENVEKNFKRTGNIEMRTGGYIFQLSRGYCPDIIEEILFRTGISRNWEEFAKLGVADRAIVGVHEDSSGQLNQELMLGIRPKIRDPKSVPFLSYVDVLAGKGDLSELQDAIVLIGDTNGRDDLLPQPDPVHAPQLASIHGIYELAFAIETVWQRINDKTAKPKVPAKIGHAAELRDPFPQIFPTLREWGMTSSQIGAR